MRFAEDQNVIRSSGAAAFHRSIVVIAVTAESNGGRALALIHFPQPQR
jgi:hypothetical protein